MLSAAYPRVALAHTPTPLEELPRLSAALDGPRIWVKREDCTGLAMGGNKARQLEYYIGDACARGADTLLTTGAIQSNHVRMTVAAARKLGLEVEVQLEHRVPGRQSAYYDSGNLMLLKLMGAAIRYYPEGEDESGADRALYLRAEELRRAGARPYVVPLGEDHTPYGCLGYVDCAEELIGQWRERGLEVAALALASGSATTHAGLLAGLRARANALPVYGFCVRRGAVAQSGRVLRKARAAAAMIGRPEAVAETDVRLDDAPLAPGYGQLNEDLLEAIRLCARHEGLLLDPTYSGKSMAGLIRLIRAGHFGRDQHVVFVHTGGTPALFAYPEIVG